MRARAATSAGCHRDPFGSRTRLRWLRLRPILALSVLTFSPHAGAELAATADPGLIADLASPVFVDTREIDTCANASIDGALCLEPPQLLFPDGSPASFRDINWLVGTFGLDSAATVVVFGDEDTDNDFVAGMLFLLGQSRVVIWRGDLRSMLDSRTSGTGRRRGILRSLYFSRPVRDGHIVLDSDARRFFGAGPASEIEFPARDSDTSLYRRDDDGALLLLAGNTREAVAGLTRLLLEQPSAPVQVHIDGLRGRTARSFGAPDERITRMMLIVASTGIVLALCIALASRRRATAKHHR